MSRVQTLDGEWILQVLAVKHMDYTISGSYRLAISDGTYKENFVVLSSQFNHLVVDGQVDKFAIIKVSRCATQSLCTAYRFVCSL